MLIRSLNRILCDLLALRHLPWNQRDTLSLPQAGSLDPARCLVALVLLFSSHAKWAHHSPGSGPTSIQMCHWSWPPSEQVHCLPGRRSPEDKDTCTGSGDSNPDTELRWEESTGLNTCPHMPDSTNAEPLWAWETRMSKTNPELCPPSH